MRFIRKVVCTFLLFSLCTGICSLYADKVTLRDGVIRLHVVGASDSQEDQSIKLQVRDAVLQAVEQAMQTLPSREDAKAFLQDRLTEIENVANRVLQSAGSADRAAVSLGRECFDTREYDTFTLPAGVYDSLRVTIGEGAGRNWWCVVFPTLCIGATSEETEDVAAGAGFSDSLTGALVGEEKYQVRFFLLDLWGKIENFFRK